MKANNLLTKSVSAASYNRDSSPLARFVRQRLPPSGGGGVDSAHWVSEGLVEDDEKACNIGYRGIRSERCRH
jgi:hypothetical protein